jgi:hypothetical protein
MCDTCNVYVFQGQVEEKAIAVQEARVNDVSRGREGFWLSGRFGCVDLGPQSSWCIGWTRVGSCVQDEQS